MFGKQKIQKTCDLSMTNSIFKVCASQLEKVVCVNNFLNICWKFSGNLQSMLENCVKPCVLN